ncbi:hypothetical protein J7337_001946 [Fusarium musae]|uniref:Urea active transporter n=1 Tax=Fusarium musae TaxID=1042133 RepID=A0A9P8ITM0_9HYPO|nr:hypothetical protein J7337_001946 [Fusarium musae]KAG9504980.1 hypothetical protein J7337_001946 [Fusarium musae]
MAARQVTGQLPQGAGYAIILGFGALFVSIVFLISRWAAKHHNEVQGSEMFTTAKRSIKSGLTAAAVVSSWTIASTLLSSTTWSYSYGVAGAYFYGAGALTVIAIFVMSAIELKRRAPAAHTFFEVSRVRYGRGGHIVFMAYSTLYCIINCVNILIGGSAVFSAMTGMSQIAAIFLLPCGIVLFTLSGGVKAVIITDYMNTIFIHCTVLAGVFVAYARPDSVLGSPEKVWELLKEAAIRAPVPGNAGGEYLTMRSNDAILLGIILWCAIFGCTIDVQLFQKSITADPAATLPGYIIGGVAWFSIPFCLATTFGLSARAMEFTELLPRAITPTEIAQGLTFPIAAGAMMGKAGLILVLIMVFMACTSGFSADTVSIASVYIHDVYKGYFNKNASGKQLVHMSHLAVAVWSLLMAVIATGISRTAIGVNYIVTCIGIFCGCAVFPFYATLLWKKQSKLAVIWSPILGSITSISSWLGSAHALFGEVTISSKSQVMPLLIGNVVSVLSGIIFSVAITYIFGADQFDWSLLQTNIHTSNDMDVRGMTARQVEEQAQAETISPEMDALLRRGTRKAVLATIIFFISMMVLWPLPMFGTSYIFSKGFFKGWVVSEQEIAYRKTLANVYQAITFIWAWGAALVITLLPLWQSRLTVLLFVKTCFRLKVIAQDDMSIDQEIIEQDRK